MIQVSKPLPGLSCKKTRKIFLISRRSVIAVMITLGGFGPTTALRSYSATRARSTVAVFSPATRHSRPPILSQWTNPPDARPDPSGEGRVVDQLYEKLMGESARVLNVYK